MTTDLVRRVWEHKHHEYKNSFTDRYQITKLVYFEDYYDMRDAIMREKQIKGWSRAKKLKIIREINPELKDIALEWPEFQ